MASDRAISTVVDVSMALLLVSAAVVTVALFLSDSGGPTHDPAVADETAQTLAVATSTVHYSVEPVRDDDLFDEEALRDLSRGPDDVSYTKTTHGSLTELIADAAVANVRVPGDLSDGSTSGLFTREGIEYERAVDGEVRETLTEAGVRGQVVAVWRPYNRSAIEGRVKVGQSSSANAADVSTTTLTVTSGFPQVDEGQLKRAYRRGGFDAAAEPIAAAIVEGYLPPGEAQLALESRGLSRQLVVYRYKRLGEMAGVPGGFEPDSFGGTSPVSRTGADARQANRVLVDNLEDQIAADLRSAYSSDTTADGLAEVVSVEEVTLVVRTW